jgi:hypothetical protein
MYFSTRNRTALVVITFRNLLTNRACSVDSRPTHCYRSATHADSASQAFQFSGRSTSLPLLRRTLRNPTFSGSLVIRRGNSRSLTDRCVSSESLRPVCRKTSKIARSRLGAPSSEPCHRTGRLSHLIYPSTCIPCSSVGRPGCKGWPGRFRQDRQTLRCEVSCLGRPTCFLREPKRCSCLTSSWVRMCVPSAGKTAAWTLSRTAGPTSLIL